MLRALSHGPMIARVIGVALSQLVTSSEAAALPNAPADPTADPAADRFDYLLAVRSNAFDSLSVVGSAMLERHAQIRRSSLMRSQGKTLSRAVLGSTLLAVALTASPARADDTEDVALLATLGLTAATGETKLGTGAGEIEAWMLTAGGLDYVAQTIGTALGGGDFILLTRDEKINLALPTVLGSRIEYLKGRIDALHCTQTQDLAAETTTTSVKPSDFIGALTTDTTIAGIEVKTEDRMLIDAVVANPQKDQRFYIPADAIAPGNNPLVTQWNELALHAKACEQDAAKKDSYPVKAFDALDKEVSARSDGASLLERAAGLAALAAKNPKLVRLAINKAGATTIVRSNIWYKLGLPGAVRIGGGLVASFRKVDPANGSVEGGIIRCGFPQRDFHKVTMAPPTDKGCAMITKTSAEAAPSNGRSGS